MFQKNCVQACKFRNYMSNRYELPHHLLQSYRRYHHQQHSGKPWSPYLSEHEPRDKTSGGKTWQAQTGTNTIQRQSHSSMTKGKVSENVANFNASVGLSHWLQSSALDAALCGILQPQHPHFKTYLILTLSRCALGLLFASVFY